MLSKTHIKYIQSLYHKKYRDELCAFIAEGTKVVLDLFKSKEFVCLQLYATKNWLSEYNNDINNFFVEEIIEIMEFELEKISLLNTPNKVLVVFSKKKVIETINIDNKITLVLDTIQDPGNLGAIIRTADWFGIKNIICSINCADMYNPKVVQSTMGSLANVNIFYTDLIKFFIKYNHISKYAAALNGIDICTIKNINEAFIIIGNEGNGISENIMNIAENKITIVKKGQAESLNAAVATGIILANFVS